MFLMNIVVCYIFASYIIIILVSLYTQLFRSFIFFSSLVNEKLRKNGGSSNVRKYNYG